MMSARRGLGLTIFETEIDQQPLTSALDIMSEELMISSIVSTPLRLD